MFARMEIVHHWIASGILSACLSVLLVIPMNDEAETQEDVDSRRERREESYLPACLILLSLADTKTDRGSHIFGSCSYFMRSSAREEAASLHDSQDFCAATSRTDFKCICSSF